MEGEVGSNSKKTVVAETVVVVVAETGCCSEVVDSKFVQIRTEGRNIATIQVLRVEAHLQQLELHFPSRTARYRCAGQLLL